MEQKENKLVLKIKENVSNNEVLQYFIQQNINIESFNEILPSLNEIFIELVENTASVSRAFQKA